MLKQILKSYADYYQHQGITLELWEKDHRIFSNDDVLQTERIQFSEQDAHSIHILNSLPAPYDHLQLLYKRDIEELYTKQSELNHFFISINFIVGPSLVILLYILIRQLTKPLRLLSQTTRNIAEGNYSERVQMNRKDEFGELAQHFNQMAAAVERHVTELSEMAEGKQRIVDNLAHELRTPLTSMQGFAIVNFSYKRTPISVTASQQIKKDQRWIQAAKTIVTEKQGETRKITKATLVNDSASDKRGVVSVKIELDDGSFYDVEMRYPDMSLRCLLYESGQ